MTAIKFCHTCANFHMPKGIRFPDEVYLCAHGARRNVVNGKPEAAECTPCYESRARFGACGPEARLFTTDVSFPGLDCLFNPADLAVDRHGLDESGEQGRVCRSESIAKNSVDFSHGDAQVFADVAPSGAGATSD